ncbi:gliding motility-associated C-terminal domain-containing protein [Adhaeribacter radiodurans]|uniref:Gliding motility-associated C-terminal domain-containing protein n=1 Tax=Adhaeribacter radiodurans TaxID=2745197 RepID=A0A7L7L8S5_9BACT|nr:gliding motility-associated C-terminal domain-containing protein [Adhaeribacter radiodurans]QMU29230.1 gliding motility-associated C-terminal domain-containing protein [Adhaeribacter radiodurans]
MAQNCAVKPDATLTDVRTISQPLVKPFVNCTNSSTAGYTLQVENASLTKEANTSYTINWGDGTPVENFTDFSARKAHTYVLRGTYSLRFTARINDCTEEKVYTVFHGSVPNVGLSFKDTDECAPANFMFDITQTELNEPSTRYTLDFGDGTVITFDQDDPKRFYHTYNTPSKGKTLGYTVTVTASNACKTTNRTGSGIYVSNGPTPDFKLEPGPLACVNSPVTLTDISDYGYNATDPDLKQFERQWTIEPATGWAYAPGYNDKSEKPIINFTQKGNYTISINLAPLEGTDPKCKGGTVSKNIEIISSPIASFNTTLTPLTGCAATVSISNTSQADAATYQWTVTPAAGVTTLNGTSLTSKDPVFKFANAGNYTIHLSATNICGTSTAPPQTVAIKNIPTVTLPGAQSYCGSPTIAFSSTNTAHKPIYNFNNTTPISYEWTVAGPAGGAEFTTSNGSTLANPTIQFDQPGVYTVVIKVTNECGISSQATQKITINAIPTAPEVSDASICINSAATLTTTATGSVEWWSAATNGTKLKTGNSYTTPVYSTAGTYTVYVVTIVNGCPSPREPVLITVNPAIDPKTIAGNPAVCEGSSPDLVTGVAATGGGNIITYLWESSTTSATTGFTPAIGKDNSPNNQQNFQPGILMVPTWFRRKAIASPCATATSNTIFTNVNPLPAAPVVPVNPRVCLGSSATLLANPVSGVTFTWYDENGTILLNNSANSNSYTTASFTREGTFTYYVTSTSSANCVNSTRTKVTVQVLPPVTNNRITIEQPAICAGETPGLINSAIQPDGGDGYGNFTYLWQSKTDRDSDWKTAANGTDPRYANNQESYQPTAITRTTTFRRLIISGSCAAPNYSNEIVIEVIPSSLAPDVALVEPICAGETAQLQVTSRGGIYEWFASETSNEVIFTGTTFFTPALSAATTYYVHNRTTSCVSPRTPVLVTVNPIISQNIITPVPATCADGTSNPLIGTEPTGGAGIGTYTYRWESRTEFTSFTPISGDLTFSKDKKDYSPGNLNENTWFRRIVRSGPCENVSAEIKVEVLPVITGNTIASTSGIEFCKGEINTNLIGTGIISGGNNQYTYIWESSTDAFRTNSTIVAQGQSPALAEYTPQNLTQNTWYRRKITSGPCLVNISNVIEIKVNPLPAAPVVAPIAPICQGSSATFTVNLVNGVTFTVFDEAGNSIPTNTAGGNRFTTPALTVAKTYTYYVLATNSSNCKSTRTPVSIQVLAPLANFNISQPNPVCTGERPVEITSTDNPTGGNNSFAFIWESKAIDEQEFKTVTTSGSNPNYQPPNLTKTTYFRRKITSGTCSEYSNVVEVKVNETIVNNLNASNQEICEEVRPGKITGLPASGGDGVTYTYLWESSRDNNLYSAATTIPGGSNAQLDFEPTMLPQGNTWFRRKVTSGACTSFSAPILIRVNAAISNNTINLTGNAANCLNTKPSPIQGSVPGGGTGTPTYIWQGSTNGITFINAPQSNTLKDYSPTTLTQTTWFRRIVFNLACLPDTSNVVKVDVYQPVTNNIITTPNQEICLGSEAATLLASVPEKGDGQYIYSWESSRDNINFTTANNTTTNPTEKDYAPGSLAKGVWYFRRWVTAGPCAAVVSQTIKITVNEVIAGNFVTANQTIRTGDKPAALTGTKPKGGNGTFTYRWESSLDNQTFSTAPGSALQQTYAPAALTKTTWFRRVALSGSCELISNVVEITVTQAITNNLISANQTICYNAVPATLTGSIPSGGDEDFTYLWEYSTTGLASDFVTAPNQAQTKDYQANNLKETTWFRRKVSSAGNTHISNVIKITVAEPLSANSISGAQTICYGNTPALLTGSAVSGGSTQPVYLWEISTDGTNFLTAPGTNNQPIYSPGALTRDTWFRRLVSSGGCANLASNTVQVKVIPLLNLASINPVTICPGSSATLTIPSNNYKIEWFETVTSPSPIYTGATFITPALNAEHTYYVQAVNQGCAGERVPVKVLLQTPAADAGSDITIAAGKSIELAGKGGVTYQWSPAEGLSNPNIANPIASPKQTTRYTLTITTAEGCTANDEVVVALLPGISVPNGFTPNNDGMNDTWEIANIEKYPDCQVTIFNRWGTQLYSSTGYKQPWDGTYNQQHLPVATYYYTIILKPGEKPVSGSLTIIK